jgi:hypothetical protein
MNPLPAQLSKEDVLRKTRSQPEPATPAGRTDRKFSVHNGNKILTRFYNYGGIGDWTITGRYDSGIYPTGSGRSYIAEFTPVIAASVVDTNGRRVHIVSDGMVSNNGKDLAPAGYQWGFEPLPGYADPNQENIAMSDDPNSWPESWPNKPSDWDGHWNGQYGKYARADQESYYLMDDSYNDEFLFYPDPADSSRRGLGLEVEVRGYQWAHVAAEDIIIWTYWITNKGVNTLDSVMFGMYGDADVGDDGDQRDDNSYFEQENAIVYQWDSDNWSTAKGGFRPAYFGWKFLESPSNSTDGIDNDFDGLVDESQFDGIDNDGDWDMEIDDIGADGLGPEHDNYPGPDEDGTEENGIPDPGEPNFEYTDNDEGDQIGLTSFYAVTWDGITADNDDRLWSQLKPGFFSVPEQGVDITFLYGSGYFSLEPGEKKKFAVAMLFGEDMADILRNAKTMQAIYDADYSFAMPPKTPTLTAVPGNRRVHLYWDQAAETSRDPIYGYDFEGYRIYRSTDPAFLEPWIITDAWGNKTFNKPLAIFDLENGLIGPHPVAFSGIQFDMGEDTGVRHHYVDTEVQNGQTYYYAIASYDRGYSDDFYQLGLSEKEGLLEVAPAECIYVVDISASGEVLALGPNVAGVVPNAPVAGYVAPNTPPSGFEFVEHDSGAATGDIIVTYIDPEEIRDGMPYRLTFEVAGVITEYSLENLETKVDTVRFAQGFSQTERNNLVEGTLSITSLDGSNTYEENIHFTAGYEEGTLTSVSAEIHNDTAYLVHYHYYPVYKSHYLDGEPFNPVFDGMKLLVYNEPLELLQESSGWTKDSKCEYTPDIRFGSKPYPADIEIRFEGTLGDSVGEDNFFGVDVPFTIWNVTEHRVPRFSVPDLNRNGVWDPIDPIYILNAETGSEHNFLVSFSVDTLVINEIVLGDTTIYDTTVIEIKPVDTGDTLRIVTSKPFANNDEYRFTTIASLVDTPLATSQLDEIAVVPNPYVVTASWEPQHLYVSGRGTRKIDFINLPQECTIKIFTMSGHLIGTLHHSSTIENGAEPWNMLSNDGLEIAYGVYIYHVDAPGVGEKIGKFAVIK